jgi:DNA-binding sugar fermentation-stimulating protein
LTKIEQAALMHPEANTLRASKANSVLTKCKHQSDSATVVFKTTRWTRSSDLFTSGAREQ